MTDLLEIRFDRGTYTFPLPSSHRLPIANSSKALLVAVTGRDHGSGRNGLGEYLLFCAEHPGESIRIRSITVWHNLRFCHSVQIAYEASSGDVRTIGGRATGNYGYYAYEGGRSTPSVMTMGNGEYPVEVRTRQGDITDQIAIYTNIGSRPGRTLFFGGNGGGPEPLDEHPIDRSRRIVAFVSTHSNGAIGRLGAISVNNNWNTVGGFVLLRELVRIRWASVRGDEVSPDDSAVRGIVTIENEDIFRRTLSFLAPIKTLNG
mmetsp:Transcript_10067/g.23087  ORF Transcript_10067/g.23087 Transcript_10067/m.23087 type:complete len:261 (+) Transcript_10067:341-1123(+)